MKLCSPATNSWVPLPLAKNAHKTWITWWHAWCLHSKALSHMSLILDLLKPCEVITRKSPYSLDSPCGKETTTSEIPQLALKIDVISYMLQAPFYGHLSGKVMKKTHAFEANAETSPCLELMTSHRRLEKPHLKRRSRSL